MKNKNVLVACEYSGIVREEFRKIGWNAISIDILDTEIPGPHIKGDIIEYLNTDEIKKYILMIGFPPCTYLCNSGVRWLHTEPGRWQKMKDGADFFKRLFNAPIKHIALENPIQHKYAKLETNINYNQIIRPYQFGETETKSTCLFLKNLPLLTPTKIIDKKLRTQKIWKMPPGPNRSKERSRTFKGIAEALADQYSKYLDSK